MESPVQQARVFLRGLNELRSFDGGFADELLLFLNKLRDSYGVIRSSHPLVSGKSFVVLNDIIGRLESNPDSALSDNDVLATLRGVLEGIVKGSILLGPLS